MKKAKSTPQSSTEPTLPGHPRLLFPVVAIGASAGGLEALKGFFEAMPSDSGMAFVVILHLNPDKLSLMAEILSRCTKMPVTQAGHHDQLQPDHIYVVPPGQRLSIRKGRLTLSPLAKDKGVISHAIDEFLRALATEQGDRAIGIILSGTGADGSLGLLEVKAAGGMIMAQEPEEAGQNGMPVSAINTGMVDFVLPVAAMPAELLHYVRHGYYDANAAPAPLSEELEAQVEGILDLLGQRQANDFSGYKRGTLIRRIERRMSIHHLHEIPAYYRLLKEDPEELAALAKDLLIGVTGFFRDPEAFGLLYTKVVVPLCRQAGPGNPIRVWVAGCATGEEAYSIAILILEELARLDKEQCGLQIFATDIDANALQQARTGSFPPAIEIDLTPERLSRFFERHEDGYRVGRTLRETITFSVQNLIRDTPFSRLDLISCRNLLIYLKAETQRRILALFHFALKPTGAIFLGNAETVGRENDLFRSLDKKWRIYKKIDSVRVPLISFPRLPSGERVLAPLRKELKKGVNLKALGERRILDHFSPCGVIINQASEILQFIGKTNLFLQVPEGAPTVNLLAMVPTVMRTPVRAMLQELVSNKQPQPSLLVRLPDQEGRPYRQVLVGARRLEEQGIDDELMLVTFSDLPEGHQPALPPEANLPDGCPSQGFMIRELEEELLRSRESLESTIEQLETANEELMANNEEAMSMNEEFQSTNEELETSKEELQSINEELTTVNAELQEKVLELEETNTDLDNLLLSSEVGFLFLDEQFRIKRFTSIIRQLFRVIDADLGRPLADFSNVFPGLTLLDEVKSALTTLVPIEKEIQTDDGRWFLQRVLPCRTRDNHIKGVLVTFLEISQVKAKAAEALQQSDFLSLLADTLPVQMLYIDSDERYRYANSIYLRWFDLKAEQVLGRKVEEVVGPTIYAAIAHHIKRTLIGEQVTYEGVFDYPLAGRRYIQATHSPHLDSQGKVLGFFVLLQDMTEFRSSAGGASYLAAIVESSNDAIISRGFDGTILSWNKGAEQMFGYFAREMVGHPIDLLFADQPAEESDGLDLICRGAGVGHCEPCCLAKDGRRFDVILTQSPILGQDDEPMAVSVIMSDISNRKQMESQLSELNRELEKKVAERTASLQQHMVQLRKLALELTQTEQRERQRLALVLHNDLQQLLVAAGMRLERMANTEPEAGKREAIRQVESLLSQSVAATRSLATDLRPPVLNSGNLVKSLHWLAEWLWKRFDLTLKFSVAEEVKTEGIPDQDVVFLFDTARELCFNIVKHAHVKEGRMTLQRNAEGRLCLTIADDGAGMDLKRVGHSIAADDGLGLGTIRERLALIGGEIQLDSAPGQGFKAEIVLPYVLTAAPLGRPVTPVEGKADRPAADRQQEVGPLTDRKIRVMLVDDHAVVRDGLKMVLLDESDIDMVGEAGDGEKGLRMAKKLRPDVIIMDVNMPKMDGIEATKRIKECCPEICIIALSINEDPGTNRAMLEAGACAYLNKSGSADDVCQVIRACARGTADQAAVVAGPDETGKGVE